MSSYTRLPRTPRLQNIPLPHVDEDYYDDELLKHALQDQSITASPSSESLVLSPYTPPQSTPLALEHVQYKFQSMSMTKSSDKEKESNQNVYYGSRTLASHASGSGHAGRRLG